MNKTSQKMNMIVHYALMALLAMMVFLLATQFHMSEAHAAQKCVTPDAPAEVKAPQIELMLKDGAVVIELRPDLAPKHVARIVTLAKQGFYDGIVFHRVIEGFMAQSGDPTGTGMGGSELPDLKAEFTPTPYQCGTLGMARSQNPDSANSQFFITFADAQFLNGQYSVFGFVKSGMDYVHMIKKGDSNRNGMVENPDKIIKMRVLKD